MCDNLLSKGASLFIMKNIVDHSIQNPNNDPTVMSILNKKNEKLEVIIHSPSNKKSIHISGGDIRFGYDFDLTDIQIEAIIMMLKS